MYRNLPLPLYLIDTGHAALTPATLDARHAADPTPQTATSDTIKLKLIGLFNHDHTAVRRSPKPAQPPLAN